MDKILQSVGGEGGKKEATITNDGATILRSIMPENAAAKILINTSKTQDQEVGDGTTSVAVLAGELLREAERLVHRKIHPQTILVGWRKSIKVAREALARSAKDNALDEKKFKEDLLSIARTTISSKILNTHKEKFAHLAVDAVMRLAGKIDLEGIQIIKKSGGTLEDSYLDDGFILEKQIGIGQLKRIENAKILIANTPMDTDKIKIFGARVKVSSMTSVANIEQAEKDKMKEKVQKILKTGCTCFINRQLIYNYPEQLFTKAGIMSIEHADFVGVERMALVTGAEIASTFDKPELIKLGKCDLIEEIMIGESRCIRFSGVAKGEACSVVLRGASSQILEEAERSLHDALCVLTQTTRNTKTVLGGGCSEMMMAEAVERLAQETPGKEAFAMEAFARAIRQIPVILADNAGYDSSKLVAELRAMHHKNFDLDNPCTMGLDMDAGTVGDVAKLRIIESYKCKSQVVISAHEAAEMIVRVDEIITCAPRQRSR